MAPTASRVRLTLACSLLAAACASPFRDLRAFLLSDLVEGRAGSARANPGAAPARAEPLRGGAQSRLDFSWNDTVAWVWVDPASTTPSTPTLPDAVFGVEHVARAALPSRGPLLGVNVTVERCEVVGLPHRGGAPPAFEVQWVPAGAPRGADADGESIPAAGGGARPAFVSLEDGHLRVPTAVAWTWLAHCTAPSCRYTTVHGPPAAITAAVAARGEGAIAAAALQAVAPSLGSAPPTFTDVGFASGTDAAVVVGDVGRIAGIAAAEITLRTLGIDVAAASLSASAVKGAHLSASAAAAAHAASVPAFREFVHPDLIMDTIRAWLSGSSSPKATATANNAPPPWTCNPGSVRISATEWAFPAQPFLIISRLALLDDAWLKDYNIAVSASEWGWSSLIRSATEHGSRLHRDGFQSVEALEELAAAVPAVASGLLLTPEAHELREDETGLVWAQGLATRAGRFMGSIKGPRSTLAVRSPASWIALDPSATTAPTAADAAVIAAGGALPPSEHAAPPALPPRLPRAAANASHFILAHWWPGYELSSLGRANNNCCAATAPPLSSYILLSATDAEAGRVSNNLLARAFGVEAWVIAMYMAFAGAGLVIFSSIQCTIERRLVRAAAAAAAARAAARGRTSSSSGQALGVIAPPLTAPVSGEGGAARRK